MGTIILLLLLLMEEGRTAHLVLKEPPRYQLAYDDWKPLRDGGSRPVRYPVYRKPSGYSYNSGKKHYQEVAEQSEKVEVFSPAPPTILGSFSVFGHATVNAREHASHHSKKSPRPQYSDFTAAESRPKIASYQIRHTYQPSYSNYGNYGDQKRIQYASNDDQGYFLEASLRAPPYDNSKTYSNPAPNSYYSYEHPYQTEQYRKSQNPQSSYNDNSYKHPSTIYSQQVTYKTTVPPNDYVSTYSYYNSPSSNIDTEYYNENPVGAVPLGIRRPEGDGKPVTESNLLHEHLHQSGSPFRTPEYSADKGTAQPFVTTYTSSLPTSQTRVKFSDVAQPFRVSNYENGPLSSAKPQTYTEEMYPVSVTTVDVPTEVETQNAKETYEDYVSHHTPFKASPYDTSSQTVKHRPYQNSYREEKPAFLPTPSTDTSPYRSDPKPEITTINTEFQESNHIPASENKVVEPSYTPTEIYTTLPPETTTRTRTHKPRRPTRPSTTSTTTEYSDEYRYQRRRKPTNKSRVRGSSDKNSYKRRTTTTTTPAPELPVEDVYTTILPQNEHYEGNDKYEYTGDRDKYEYTGDRNKYENTEDKDKYEYMGSKDRYEYSGDKDNTETKVHEEEQPNHKYEEVEEERVNIVEAITTPSTTTTSTTPAPTTAQTSQTTASTTTQETSGRLKNKYGSRPRFSIKDYRDKLNKATSTVAPHEIEKTEERKKPARNETEYKFGGKTRFSTSRTSTTTEAPQSQKNNFEQKFQKYKPRLGPSRYKTSTTAAPEAETTTTTERSNTFKPSTNRYKPGTGKYYARYRTSTLGPKEVDDSPATTTAKITIRPKGVFSAKRQPFPIKNKTDPPKTQTFDDEEEEEEKELGKFTESLKINDNEVYSAVLKKMDDATTTTIASEEDESENNKDIEKDPTGQESLRIADLTSSSSNDFHQTSYFKNRGATPSRRPIPKITLPTDNPILPLEAFFQTQNN